MRVVGYVRVSTEEQAKEGISLDTQEAKIRQYAKLCDLGKVEIISDKGKSAKDLKREGIQRVLTLTKEKEIKHLIIYKLDRLTRDLADQLHLIETFKEADVEFHSITEKIDTGTAVGKLFLNMVGSINQFIRDQIAEVTRDALQHKKQKGEPLGPPALGFKAKDKKRIEDPEGLKIVKYIKALKRKRLSLRAIAKRLNQEDFRTKRGGKWHHSTISKIVKNSHYRKVR